MIESSRERGGSIELSFFRLVVLVFLFVDRAFVGRGSVEWVRDKEREKWSRGGEERDK